MKKLTEELKNLDIENEYKIPDEFRENVMKKVNKEVKIYNTKYVIATISMAAIVILGFFVAGRNGRMINLKQDNIQLCESVDDQVTFDMVEISNNTVKEYETVAMKAMNESRYMYDSSINLNELAKLFKDANIEFEEFEDHLKAKCSIERAEEILSEYDVSIESDGEYVIIK